MLRKYQFYLFPAFFFSLFTLLFSSCGSKEAGKGQSIVNEENTKILLNWLETNGNYIASERAPSIIDAPELFGLQDQNILIIDLRPQEDYDQGHIEFSVNIGSDHVLDYFKNRIEPSAFDYIVFVCNNDNRSSYVTAVLRLLGYNNTWTLRFGMSGLDREIADQFWFANISNKMVGKLEYTPNEKKKPSNYPSIAANGKSGFDIVWERAEAIINLPADSIFVSIDQMIDHWDDYYTICYWPEEKYLGVGHLPGSVQYDQKTSLNQNSELNTLSTEKPNIIYCYSGQHSIFVTAYLRLIGYNAKALRYGANSFMHQVMAETESKPTRTFTEKSIFNAPITKSQPAAPANASGVIPIEKVKVAGGC